jgi:hypothetical protein
VAFYHRLARYPRDDVDEFINEARSTASWMEAPGNRIAALDQPIRIFAIIHPPSGIQLTAIDHHRSYAEADQAPKPYALHGALQRDVERGIDHDRTRVTADKQEQTGPLGLPRRRAVSTVRANMTSQEATRSPHSTKPGTPARARIVICRSRRIRS